VREYSLDHDSMVSVLVLEVSPGESARLVSEAASLMRRKTKLEGFVEGEIFQSDDRTRVLIATEWQSNEAWSRSQWDREVGNAVVAIFTTATAVESRTYYRTARVAANFRTVV